MVHVPTEVSELLVDTLKSHGDSSVWCCVLWYAVERCRAESVVVGRSDEACRR
jgi:hypothetical protein